MKQRLYIAMLMVTGIAQANEPKSKASDYPVHAATEHAEIGVEYMVRSFGADTLFLVDDFLIVEVAIYPAARTEVNVDARKFTMRLNGKKDAIFPQSAGMVAASIKYPDWRRKPQLVMGGGVGDGGVVIGSRTPTERFPGDPTTRGRLPAPPRAPSQDPVAKEPVDIAGLLQKHSLPEGRMTKPVAGYLYFPYTGKLTKLKKVELFYSDGSDPVVLRLK